MTLRIDVHHFFEWDAMRRVEHKLDTVLAVLTRIEQEQFTMSKELDDLTVQVQANTDLEQSAITLIEGLAAQIAASATDPIKVAALSAQLKASSVALAAAITANTTPPVPAPTP